MAANDAAMAPGNGIKDPAEAGTTNNGGHGPPYIFSPLVPCPSSLLFG
jgi:hypothetical protein